MYVSPCQKWTSRIGEERIGEEQKDGNCGDHGGEKVSVGGLPDSSDEIQCRWDIWSRYDRPFYRSIQDVNVGLVMGGLLVKAATTLPGLFTLESVLLSAALLNFHMRCRLSSMNWFLLSQQKPSSPDTRKYADLH